MLLTVDVGNSSMKMGLFRGEKVVEKKELKNAFSKGPFQREVRAFLRRAGVEAAVFCSVVPDVVPWLKRELRDALGKAPLEVTHRLKLGFKIQARPAGAVGTDRLANAAAAVAYHRLPCIVVDFGTATTFDVVSGRKEYLGGAIVPGLRASAEVLGRSTAQLPLAAVSRPLRAVGRNTLQAIRSGLVYGQLGQIKEILGKMRRELGERPRVVATGGYSKLLVEAGAPFDLLDQELTLKGLKVIHQLNAG